MEARTKCLYVLMFGGIVVSVCCQAADSTSTNTTQTRCVTCLLECTEQLENCTEGVLCSNSCREGYYFSKRVAPGECSNDLQDEVLGQSSSGSIETRTIATPASTSTTSPPPLLFCELCVVSGCSICQDEEDQRCQTCQEGYILHNTSGQCYLLDQTRPGQLSVEAIAGIVIGIILFIVIGIAVAIVVLRRLRGAGDIADHVKIEKNQEKGRWGRTESKELDQMGLAPPPPLNPYTDMGTVNDKSYDPLNVSQPEGPTEDYSPLKEEDYLNPQQIQEQTTDTESIYVNSNDKNPDPSSVNQSTGRGKSGFPVENGNNHQMPEVRAQGSVDIYEPMDANQGASFDIYVNQDSLALVESAPETEDDIYVNTNGDDDVYQNQ